MLCAAHSGGSLGWKPSLWGNHHRRNLLFLPSAAVAAWGTETPLLIKPGLPPGFWKGSVYWPFLVPTPGGFKESRELTVSREAALLKPQPAVYQFALDVSEWEIREEGVAYQARLSVALAHDFPSWRSFRCLLEIQVKPRMAVLSSLLSFPPFK